MLGEIWAKMVPEVPRFKKIRARQEMNCSRFGQVCGNLGKNPSHPQTFACSYIYGWNNIFKAHLYRVFRWRAMSFP